MKEYIDKLFNKLLKEKWSEWHIDVVALLGILALGVCYAIYSRDRMVRVIAIIFACLWMVPIFFAGVEKHKRVRKYFRTQKTRRAFAEIWHELPSHPVNLEAKRWDFEGLYSGIHYSLPQAKRPEPMKGYGLKCKEHNSQILAFEGDDMILSQCPEEDCLSKGHIGAKEL
ncbi:hypothetical protein ACFL4W_03050 [Planctomycetota bacterium]